jgi:hypothetical protein
MAGWGSILSKYGRFGDSRMAHVNPGEAMLMKQLGGAGTRNPVTGALEFYTAADVTGLYHEVLGRAPENQAAIDHHLSMVDKGWSVGDLRKAFINSEENKLQAENTVRTAYQEQLGRSVESDNVMKHHVDNWLLAGGGDRDIYAAIAQSDEAKARRAAPPPTTTTTADNSGGGAPGWASSLQEAINNLTTRMSTDRPQAVPQILETPGVVSTPQNSARSGVPGVVSSGGARTLRGVVNRRTGQIEYTPVMGDVRALDPVFRNQRRGGWANSIQF